MKLHHRNGDAFYTEHWYHPATPYVYVGVLVVIAAVVGWLVLR